MSEDAPKRGIGRRAFLRSTTFLAAATTLTAACSSAPAAPAKPAEPAKPAAPAAGAKPKDVPRNKTLVAVQGGREGKHIDHELWNPYAVGANHQNHVGIFYEPLAYYSAFADKEILWLAESYQYSPDYKTLTIKTRSGINWSDGKPFSAEDVAYTFNTLRDLGSKVRWGVDIQQFLQEAKATDPNTVVINFKVPNPRFFDFVSYKYDIGVYIVPKHIFDGQDWASFRHYDPAKDWPVTTGPWKVILGAPEQKVIDRRDDWWAVKAGLAKMPPMERILHLPFAGEQQLAQALITNQVDFATSLQPSTFPTVIQQNPKIVTHSGREKPFGYVDWWPISLWVNNTVKPWDDPDVRWALSYYIDRQQIIDVSWAGAGTLWPVPMPSYPPLRPYVDTIKDLLTKYDTLAFDPAKGNALLEKKGWKKQNNMWVDAAGAPVKLDILGPVGTWSPAVGPVVQELLRRQGIDCSFATPPDANDRFSKGEYVGFLNGHGGSIKDPYLTLRLYQSVTNAVPGAHLVNFAKWTNKKYDEVVDRMATTAPTEKDKMHALYKEAMEIWLPELPDIQLTEFYHRIPMNTTYWKGWPSKENPYVNEAFWHLTYGYLLSKLEPA